MDQDAPQAILLDHKYPVSILARAGVVGVSNSNNPPPLVVVGPRERDQGRWFRHTTGPEPGLRPEPLAVPVVLHLGVALALVVVVNQHIISDVLCMAHHIVDIMLYMVIFRLTRHIVDIMPYTFML